MLKHLSNICIALCFFSTLSYASNDTIRVRLKWWHQFQFAGYYAAQIKGFYQKENLNVQLFEGNKKTSTIQEVLNGNVDFGISGTDLLSSFTSGKPIVAVGALFQHSPYVIISDEKKGIRSPTDLIGKKIMATDTQGWTELQALFLREGISLDSLQIINHTWNNKDIVNGYADAMSGYQSVEVHQLTKLGIKPSYIEPINYGIDFYGDVLFCLASTTKKMPEETNAFISATFKGWEYALKNSEEIARYILTLPGVKERGVTLEDLLKEANAMKKLILSELVEIGHMNEGRWEHILAIHQHLGLIDKRKTITGFVYNPKENSLSFTIKYIIYASLFICLLIILISLYSYSLKKAVNKRTEELNNEITNRAKAQEALQISEERLELATQAAGLGIWDWNILENNIYFSTQWKTMLGYAEHELKNEFSTFGKLIHPEDKENFFLQLHEYVEGKQGSFQSVIRMRKKDTSWKWILTLYKVIHTDTKGRANRITGVHVDIDEIKQKEKELEDLTKELMNSNKELQQFAYITSHNLRAPVANLISLLKLFKKEELSQKNIAYFDKINFSVNKLNNTLDDLNQILSSRINKDVQTELLNFNNILKETKASVQEFIAQKKATITSDFSKAPAIFCVKKIIDSIFINLLTNGLKYQKPNIPPIVHFETDFYKDHIVLTITDNGLGIDMDQYAQKIFGLYQRFHETIEGKGIGLYIIKNQIESIGGKIEVSSKLGEGTTFKIFLKPKLEFYDAQKN